MPQAMMVISHLAKGVPGIVVGAGSVTNPEAALQCLDAGAQFLTSDGFHPSVVEFGSKRGVVVIPGALTPTEVISAWRPIRISSKSFRAPSLAVAAYIGSLHVIRSLTFR